MRILFTLIALSFTSYTNAQIAGDMLFGGGIDLIKTDNENAFSKMQLGLETNYYFTKNLTGSAGFEFWIGNKTSISLGGRWYLTDAAFLRVRGLIGENDLSLGGGWTRPLSEDLKLEAMGDFILRATSLYGLGWSMLCEKKNKNKTSPVKLTN